MSLHNLIESIRTGLQLLDKPLQWAVASKQRRLLVFMLIVIALLGGYYGVTFALLERAKADSNSVQTKVDIVLEKHLVQTQIEWTNLCQSALKEKDSNANWYCQHAIELYASRNRTPPDLKQQIIDKKAYGAMVVDLTGQLRGLEIDSLYKTKPQKAQLLLDKLMSKTGLLLILIMILLVLSLTAIWLVHYKKGQARIICENR